MNLRSVLLYALNHQAVSGSQFDRSALDAEVIEVFEQNGVDVDEVIREVEENEDDHLDLF